MAPSDVEDGELPDTSGGAREHRPKESDRRSGGTRKRERHYSREREDTSRSRRDDDGQRHGHRHGHGRTHRHHRHRSRSADRSTERTRSRHDRDGRESRRRRDEQDERAQRRRRSRSRSPSRRRRADGVREEQRVSSSRRTHRPETRDRRDVDDLSGRTRGRADERDWEKKPRRGGVETTEPRAHRREPSPLTMPNSTGSSRSDGRSVQPTEAGEARGTATEAGAAAPRNAATTTQNSSAGKRTPRGASASADDAPADAGFDAPLFANVLETDEERLIRERREKRQQLMERLEQQQRKQQPQPQQSTPAPSAAPPRITPALSTDNTRQNTVVKRTSEDDRASASCLQAPTAAASTVDGGGGSAAAAPAGRRVEKAAAERAPSPRTRKLGVDGEAPAPAERSASGDADAAAPFPPLSSSSSSSSPAVSPSASSSASSRSIQRHRRTSGRAAMGAAALVSEEDREMRMRLLRMREEANERGGGGASPAGGAAMGAAVVAGQPASDAAVPGEPSDAKEFAPAALPSDARMPGSALPALGAASSRAAAEVEFDMFSDSPTAVNVERILPADRSVKTATAMMDSTDAEGYYVFRPGELLDSGRYVAVSTAGKGVFSTVVRARLADTQEEVAIKVIRNNDVMLRAGAKELLVVKRLNEADPSDRRHCVRLTASFYHGRHLCLVFEALNANLREVLRRYGGGKGISMQGVRLYARQILSALHLLLKCRTLHADIKPDNILVNDSKTAVKLADFGSASSLDDEVDITPYLVSRFYRAPEIVLGLPYGAPIDMWSTGCCLFELYTGRIAFPGRSNNEMLRLMQEMVGPIPNKLLRKSLFREQHYDENGRFLQRDVDPVTSAEVVRVVETPARGRTVKELIVAAAEASERRLALLLANLIEKMFIVDPARRISVQNALKHEFFNA